MSPTFAGRFTLSLIDFAALQGVSRVELIISTGLTERDMEDEECRLDIRTFNRIIELAVSASGDELFGLHAGAHLNLAAAGLIGQITHTSRTVKEALDYCCEFASLGCRALPMELKEENEFYRLAFIPDPRWLADSTESVRHVVEGTLAFTIREYRALTRERSLPAFITFDHPRPQRSAEFERVLGVPLRFDMEETAIYFHREQVDQSVTTSNYALLRLLVEHARARLAEIAETESFTATVERTVLHLGESESPTIEGVARTLAITPRTLQRRLAEEEETFTRLIDRMRHERAIGYLRNRTITLSETAYLLGYADPGSFVRSFKRWTGMTPGAFRRSA